MRGGPTASPTLRRTERSTPRSAAAAGLGAHLAECSRPTTGWRSSPTRRCSPTRFAVAGDVTEERSHWPGEQDPTVIVLRQGGGLRRELRVGTELAAVVGACDGELSLGAIVAAVAELLELDEAALSADLLPAVRALIDDGMLLLPSE